MTNNQIQEIGDALEKCFVLVADQLLAGNDTQCFTTDQVRSKFLELMKDACEQQTGVPQVVTVNPMGEQSAAIGLRRIGCREVKPGVWTRGLA